MNPYEILNVPVDADDAAIERAYKKAAAVAHPDNQDGGSNDAFLQVKKAKDVLLDPMRRSIYDSIGLIFGDDPESEQAILLIVEIVNDLLGNPRLLLSGFSNFLHAINGAISGRRELLEEAVAMFKRSIEIIEANWGGAPMVKAAIIKNVSGRMMTCGASMAACKKAIELMREVKFTAVPTPRPLSGFGVVTLVDHTPR